MTEGGREEILKDVTLIFKMFAWISLTSDTPWLRTGAMITNSRILINARSGDGTSVETDSDRYTNSYLSATSSGRACGSRELARVTKSSFPRSLSRSSARAAAASEAAEKCFRTNWRALIDEATESFPRNRGSSGGAVYSSLSPKEATVPAGCMKSATTPSR